MATVRELYDASRTAANDFAEATLALETARSAVDRTTSALANARQALFDGVPPGRAYLVENGSKILFKTETIVVLPVADPDEPA